MSQLVSPHRSRFRLPFSGSLLICLSLGLLTGFAGFDGPVGFVGDGYGRLELKYLTERVAPEVDGLSFENCGEHMAAAEFVNYRMVVITGLGEKGYSAEETELVEEYVRKGGRLVLVQQTPKAFVYSQGGGDLNSNYLFGRSTYFRGGSECTVYELDDPLLAGAFTEEAKPFWLKASVMLKGLDWENLIGNGDDILVGRLSFGEGVVYYMGHETFRLAKTARDEGQEPALLGWIQIWKNILSRPEAQ